MLATITSTKSLFSDKKHLIEDLSCDNIMKFDLIKALKDFEKNEVILPFLQKYCFCETLNINDIHFADEILETLMNTKMNNLFLVLQECMEPGHYRLALYHGLPIKGRYREVFCLDNRLIAQVITLYGNFISHATMLINKFIQCACQYVRFELLQLKNRDLYQNYFHEITQFEIQSDILKDFLKDNNKTDNNVENLIILAASVIDLYEIAITSLNRITSSIGSNALFTCNIFFTGFQHLSRLIH